MDKKRVSGYVDFRLGGESLATVPVYAGESPHSSVIYDRAVRSATVLNLQRVRKLPAASKRFYPIKV